VRYRFGEIELDAGAYTLTRSGRALALQPKVFDVLRYLLEHRDRVVSKDELLRELWPGEHVNESAVPWSISHARSALGQRRGQKRPIETVHGRGYRFTAPVQALNSPAAPGTAPQGAISVPASIAPTARPFVGRAAIMRRLEDRLEATREGHGRLCLLCGEPGIGKTRCAEELMARARKIGFRTWVGRATEGVGAPVFWPWIQILREAVREHPELRDAGEPLLSRLVALEPKEAPPVQAGAERERRDRFWLLDEIAQLLLRAARKSPILLLIDDLQWADAGSIKLLGFLAPELENARLLIVATERDETSPGGARRLAQLARHAERIDLTRLTAIDVGLYIMELTAGVEPAEQLAQAVYRASTGNPLFVQETLRALIDEHGHSALSTLAATAVTPPDVARDVLRLPLEALDAGMRALLSQASVLGEGFDLALLQAVSGEPMQRLLEMAEAASRSGLITAETPERYRFSHALLRSILYDEMATAERVAVHRRAAEALEALRPVEPRHNEIAYHFYHSLPAGDYGRVATAARRAAEAAEALLAHEDAVAFYEWALEAQALDPSSGPRERATLLLACGSAQRFAGRDSHARATLARLFELARQHGYAELLLRAARVLRPTYAMAAIPDPFVREALEEVLRIAPEGPGEQRIGALSQLACVPPYATDMRRSKELSGRALELARQLGERASLFEALRSRLYSLSGPDDIDALLAVTDEILALERDRAGWMSGEAYGARFAAFVHRGDLVEADGALAALGQTARQLRLPEAIWYHDRLSAQRRARDGDFAAAETACNELRARSQRMGLSYGATFTDIVRGALLFERRGVAAWGEGWDFTALLRGGAAQAPTQRAHLARSAARVGQLEPAQATLDSMAAHGFELIPKDISYLNTLACLATAAVILDDRPRAERLYELLSPYPEHNTPDGMLFYEGSVSHYLAELAACVGRDDRVAAHFETALVMNQRLGQRPQLARTRLAYARWLGLREGRAERERAKELERAAYETGAELGMEWLVAGQAFVP
jgi:DNA-binding winged helix-turn-helix (wHTH) protein